MVRRERESERASEWERKLRQKGVLSEMSAEGRV
jgi:hypothetical protein